MEMDKERIEQMAEVIGQLKEVVNPLIMQFTMEEWEELNKKLDDRHSTAVGGAPIITAMGGDWELKSLQTRFQAKMGKAMYAYAKFLYEALDIQKNIEKYQSERKASQAKIEKMFG